MTKVTEAADKVGTANAFNRFFPCCKNIGDIDGV